MLRGIYTAGSAMAAEQIRQDVITNNLANVNTAGYKRDDTITQEFSSMLLMQLQNRSNPVQGDPTLGRIGTGIAATEIATLHTQGTTYQTGNPLDLAIEGEGFFVVQNPQTNDIRYTRSGHFLTNEQNQLVTEDGWNVLSNNGPFTLPAGNAVITDEGQITGTPQALRIVTFANAKDLTKDGNNRYRADNAAPTALDFGTQPRPATRIQQGSLEGSNVNPVQEMVSMITAMRAYETSQRVIQSQDQTLDKAVNELGRI